MEESKVPPQKIEPKTPPVANSKKSSGFSICDLFADIPEIHIVDLGASPIDGNPVYAPISNRGGCRCSCFEPNPVQFARLQKQSDPQVSVYPFAIADGKESTLNICAAPGMSSLLEPNMELLSYFHGFSEWAKIVDRQPLTTRRLDDIQEIQDIDFLKLDVQGSELAILENATRQLAHVSVVHVETALIPLYKNQPLFGDIDLIMRREGFMFHRFGNIQSKVLQPLVRNNDILAGFSQVLDSDAVYVRPFVQFKDLEPAQLLKIARILHDVYGSFDLANLALRFVDRSTGTNRESLYLQKLLGKS